MENNKDMREIGEAQFLATVQDESIHITNFKQLTVMNVAENHKVDALFEVVYNITNEFIEDKNFLLKAMME